MSKCNEAVNDDCDEICLEKHLDGCAFGLDGDASGLDGYAPGLDGDAFGLETSPATFLEPSYIDGPSALPSNDKNIADGRVRRARLLNTTLFADATNPSM